MMRDTGEIERDPVPEVCVSCRFGSGAQRDCTLIRTKALRDLFEFGPCAIEGRFREMVHRHVVEPFPMAESHAADAAQEAVLDLLGLDDAFPGDRLLRLPALERWLERFARNRVIDHLRRVRVIARLRCGSCRHFAVAPPPRCTLEFVGDPTEELRPNPWWGRKVERHTDPRHLEPPCGDFSWRRTTTFDLFEHESVELGEEYSRREKAAVCMVQALDRLASSSIKGLREASTLQRHYLGKESVADIAASMGVSEKTVKRLLAAGRADLLTVLQKELGVESVADLM